MNKYLEYLGKINPFFENKDYTYLLKLLIMYVKGQLKDYELIKNVKSHDLDVFYTLMNNLISFNDEKIRYFIELPDKNFETKLPKCILVGKLNSYQIFDNFYNTLGPIYIRKTLNFFDDHNFIQIRGNFSKIPKGALITTSDYFKIISKLPGFYDLMDFLINNPIDLRSQPKNEQEIIDYVNSSIRKGINTEEMSTPSENWIITAYQTHLSDEIIDSIEFDKEVNFFSLEEILSGNFGTFKELINEEPAKGTKLIYFPTKKVKL